MDVLFVVAAILAVGVPLMFFIWLFFIRTWEPCPFCGAPNAKDFRVCDSCGWERFENP